MNKIFSYCTIFIFMALALIMGACTEEYEYSAATAEGEQVYFKTTLASNYDLDPAKNSFAVQINRIQSKGELTVKINAVTKEGTIYTVPETVTFADGATTADINISYSPETLLSDKCGYGYYEDITLSVGDESYTTPYGDSSCTISAGLTEWIDTGEEATYRDGLISSVFGIEPLTYKVPLQKSALKEGRYRLKNPYGEDTEIYKMYNGGGITFNNDNGIIFDISDPAHAYVDGTILPGKYGSDNILLYSYVTALTVLNGYDVETLKQVASEYFGTYQDGIITMPAESFLMELGTSQITSPQYYSNSDGMFAIAMPGYEITDYTSSFTYTGRFTDTKDNSYVQGTITLGKDVASARWIIATEGDDINEIISAINEGTIESNYITSGEDIQAQLTESGNYVMIIVTYDKEGNMKGCSTTTFEFSLDNNASNWQPIYTGTFTHNVEPAFIIDENENYVGNPIIDYITKQYSTTMYQDQNNPSQYKIEPWIADGQSLTFEMDAQGKITFKDVNTGFSQQQYGTLYAGDAAVLFNEPNAASSYYDAKNKTYHFGTVYYVYINGEYGYFGGADETFTVGQAQGVRPFKGHKMLSPKMFKTYSKLNIEKSVRKTAVQKPTLKRAKFVKE